MCEVGNFYWGGCSSWPFFFGGGALNRNKQLEKFRKRDQAVIVTGRVLNACQILQFRSFVSLWYAMKSGEFDH